MNMHEPTRPSSANRSLSPPHHRHAVYALACLNVALSLGHGGLDVTPALPQLPWRILAVTQTTPLLPNIFYVDIGNPRLLLSSDRLKACRSSIFLIAMDDVVAALAEGSTTEHTMEEQTPLPEEDHHSDHHPEQDKYHRDEVMEGHGGKTVAETEPQGQETDSPALDDVRTEDPVASKTEPEHPVGHVTRIETAALYDVRAQELVVSAAETEHNVDQATEEQPQSVSAYLNDVPTEDPEKGQVGVAAALHGVPTVDPEKREGIGELLAHAKQQQLSYLSADKSEVASQPIEVVEPFPSPLDAVAVVSGTEPELTMDQVIEGQPMGTDAAVLGDVQREDPQEGAGKEGPLAHLVQREVSDPSLGASEIAPHDDRKNPTEASEHVPLPLYDVTPVEISDSAFPSKDFTDDNQVKGDKRQNQVDIANEEVTDSGNAAHEEGMPQSAERVPENISSVCRVICSVDDSDLAPQSREGFHSKVEANRLGEDAKVQSDFNEENLEGKPPVLTMEPVQEVEMQNSAITQPQVPSDQQESIDAAHKALSSYIFPDKEAVNLDEVKDDVDQSIVADIRKEDLDASEEMGSNRKEHKEQPLMESEHGLAFNDRKETANEGCLIMEGASATELLGSNRDEHKEKVLKKAECAALSMDREEAVGEEMLVLEDGSAIVSALSARAVSLMPSDGNGDPCTKGHLVQPNSMDFSGNTEDEAKRKNVQVELPVEDMKANDNVVKELLFSNDPAVGMSLPPLSEGRVAHEESLLDESVAKDAIKVEELSTRHLPCSEPHEVTHEESPLSDSVSWEVTVDRPAYNARSSTVNGPTATSSAELDKDHTQFISHIDATSQDDVGNEEANKFLSRLKVPLMFAAGAAIVVGLAIALSRRH